MKYNHAKKSALGFTLVEVILFIVVAGLMMNTLLLGARTVLLKTPQVHNQKIALETARMCMEWFLQQRYVNGYNTFSCPSTPTASACTGPTGFSVSTSIACATWFSDSNYYTVTVSVTGLASASLTMQLGKY